MDFRCGEPVAVDALEAGLTAARVPIRAGTYALKARDPSTWCHDLLHLWRRHPHKPAVPPLYQRKVRFAQQMLTKFFSDDPARRLPVTFDNW